MTFVVSKNLYTDLRTPVTDPLSFKFDNNATRSQICDNFVTWLKNNNALNDTKNAFK